MKKTINHLFIALFMLLIQNINAHEIPLNFVGKDTSLKIKMPVILKTSTLFTPKSIGFQIGLDQYFIEKIILKQRKSGAIKTIKKDRFLSLDLGYYYQAGLHHNWSLTAAYVLKRTGNRGFYSEFSPFLGVSRTFIAEETYSVDNNNNVTISKLAGDWYATSGFSYGIGQTFNPHRNFMLKDISLKLFMPIFYPNFGSVAIKPQLQLGTSFQLDAIKKIATIKIKKRHFK